MNGAALTGLLSQTPTVWPDRTPGVGRWVSVFRSRHCIARKQKGAGISSRLFLVSVLPLSPAAAGAAVRRRLSRGGDYSRLPKSCSSMMKRLMKSRYSRRAPMIDFLATTSELSPSQYISLICWVS